MSEEKVQSSIEAPAGYLSTGLDPEENQILNELVEWTEKATSMSKIGRGKVIRALLLEFGPVKIAEMKAVCQEQNSQEGKINGDSNSRTQPGGSGD